MYKKIRNNSHLFMFYGEILCKTATKRQDFLKAEKFYKQSLSIDDKNVSTHNNYGLLLSERLNNSDRAEYHYKKSVGSVSRCGRNEL